MAWNPFINTDNSVFPIKVDNLNFHSITPPLGCDLILFSSIYYILFLKHTGFITSHEWTILYLLDLQKGLLLKCCIQLFWAFPLTALHFLIFSLQLMFQFIYKHIRLYVLNPPQNDLLLGFEMQSTLAFKLLFPNHLFEFILRGLNVLYTIVYVVY